MRIRYLTEEEIQTLLGKCHVYLQRTVVCAINTGMRKGEILNLQWDDIKIGFICLYGRMTKTKDARQIPISDDLQALLKQFRRDQQLTFKYIFTYKGNRVEDVKTAFNAATKRAGVMDFKFHDLRHTCASHMAVKGASMKEIQEILGHKTMTLRYAHLSQDPKKKAVNRLNGLTASVICHKTVTTPQQGLRVNL